MINLGAYPSGYKFAKSNINNEVIDFSYGNIYCINDSSLVAGADAKQVELLLKLADSLEPPFFILYVLLVSRRNHPHGRYQSPPINTRAELAAFLRHFKQYIETDGRHHIWIGTANNSGLLVYDRHNVIIGYGGLDSYADILKHNGFVEKDVLIPFPHMHRFYDENDAHEWSIFKYFDWIHFPLEPVDEE